MFLDEIQVYDGASSTATSPALLEQTAKYGIRGYLLNQNPERLTKETLNALTTNRSHLIVTALNAHAGALIAREWGGEPPASAISALPRHTFIAQVTHHGQLTHPFLFKNETVEEHFADAVKPEAIPEIQPTIDEASGRSDAATTISALDTLDQRIRQHLQEQRKAKQGEAQASGASPERSSETSDRPWRSPPPQSSTEPSSSASTARASFTKSSGTTPGVGKT